MPELVVKLGDSVVHKYFFDKDILNVGRARDNDITIENLAVSRNHARIRQIEGKYILTDLNSANGTYVNGVRVTKTEVMHNDVITIGKHNIIFLNKTLSDEQIISDAFGADRTMIVDRTPTGILIVSSGKQKDQEFRLTKHENFIGRSTNNDIKIHDWFVSKRHASIVKQGNSYFIKDLGSWRGVFVDGQPIKDTQLKDGDDIKLGATHMTFHLKTEEPLQLSGRMPRELGYVESEEELEEMPTPSEQAVPTPFNEYGTPQTPLEEVELAVGFEKFDEEEEAFEHAGAESIDDQAGTSREAEEVVQGVEQMYEKEVKAFGDLDDEDHREMEEEEIEKLLKSEFSSSEMQEEIEEEHISDKEVVAEEEREIEEEEGEEKPEPGEEVPDEIKLWEEALSNKSPIIRKEAARMLRKLTGIDYEY